jgi:hypothetical protein
MTHFVSFDHLTIHKSSEQPVAARFGEIEGTTNLAQTQCGSRIVKMEEDVERLFDCRCTGQYCPQSSRSV